MATTGVDTWNPQLAYIIKQALINSTAVDENDDVPGPAYTQALFQLNAMVKSLEATGIHVWTEEEGILFLQQGQARYVIGTGAGLPTPPSPDHTADAYAWTQLTTTAPAAIGATTLTVASIAGVASGYNIGVVDSNGLTEWTTVNGAPAGHVVTLAAPLTASVPSGSYALVYQTPLSRALKVPRARLYTLQSANETPMTPMSRQEYMDLPQKNSPGTPTQFFYSPRRDQGLFYVWPVPVLSNWAARYTWYRPLQDFLTPANTVDFPQEWINPLIWNLTKEMAVSYGVPDPTWARIKEMADMYSMLAISYDRESEDVQFGMDVQGQ